MRDPYEVLGVPKQASPANVKSAFRRLAKKLHPDANKNDPKAAARFSEINSAYEILGDEAKRKAFDNGEIDAEGKPKFRGFEGFGAGAQQGRAQGFGQGRGGNFEQFTWGAEGFQQPGGGGGRGYGGFEDILKDIMGGAARGNRQRAQFEPDDFGAPAPGRDVTGAVTITLNEAATGGSRRVYLPTGKEIDVKIPPGLNDGQTIRLKGQGMPGAGGVAGDALISVAIAPHPLFQREGANLRLELPIALYEAVLGGKVRVPTLDGAVELAIPKGTNSGRTFRLRGKGMPGRDGAGDLLVAIRIVLPERADPELEALMEKLRDANPYDPRKDMA